ncbi:DUF3667 domain-containing protein [Aquimonas voraii]|uniref:DUF3667 domain-containing protein n=1 Tax=Aquimonas voraii TaxID=265719 RepID=A0A1G7AFK3_9GAMM|nr:DUF3667 domain-containing protein [Aquimonas voraii]SDE13463.1 Protein of unknown function [Aquimonas voraii]
MDSRPAETSPSFANAPAAGVRLCENCGAELRGEHCYACGQPTKGLVRHFSSIVGDFADTVFNVDGRIFRTLGPLLFKPGFLSLEYFAGRRVRYVSPVRLFVFTCLLAFLASRLSVDTGEAALERPPIEVASTSMLDAKTVAEVEAARDAALAEFDKALKETPNVPGLGIGLQAARQGIEAEAQRRIRELQKAEAAETGDAAADRASTATAADSAADNAVEAESSVPTAAASAGAGMKDGPSEAQAAGNRALRSSINFGNGAWDPQTNPVKIGWLPELANARLNAWISRALDNSERVNSNPRLLAEAFLDFLPQTLFVLLPIFALMLKLAYLFKRRLYMEHLIVALHSHAFLSTAVLLLALATLARTTLGEGLLHAALGWVELALALWMPLYLLIMQKRVYRQGWILTLLKYGLLGTAYTVLISVGITVTLLISLVAM